MRIKGKMDGGARAVGGVLMWMPSTNMPTQTSVERISELRQPRGYFHNGGFGSRVEQGFAGGNEWKTDKRIRVAGLCHIAQCDPAGDPAPWQMAPPHSKGRIGD